MNLWIRSQDKNRLTKVDDLYIVHDDNNFCDYIGNNMVGHLAKYTKQGRALEILDEIQNILKPQMKMITHSIAQENFLNYSSDVIIQPPLNELQIEQADTWVYQMPEK